MSGCSFCWPQAGVDGAAGLAVDVLDDDSEELPLEVPPEDSDVDDDALVEPVPLVEVDDEPPRESVL